MKSSSSNVVMAMLVCSFALLFMAVRTAPLDEEEQVENLLADHDVADSGQSDPVNSAALRRLLLQLNAEDRMVRDTRSWPLAEPRGWGLRTVDGRLARQWRADKRQGRFRQCYFNPISCFKK